MLTPKQENFIVSIDPQIAALIQTNQNSSDENKFAPIEGEKDDDSGLKCQKHAKTQKVQLESKKIYDEILECKGQEAENPLENEADRNDFRYVFLERLSTI